MSTVPPSFKLERYFAKYEFTTKHLLCCSDVDGLMMNDVIKMADEETRAMWNNLKLEYTTSEGHPLLRKEISSLHGIHEDNILTVTPQEGIYIAMHCLIDHIRKSTNQERPHVVATYPAYQSLYENVKTLQCDVDYWTVRESKTGWKFDLDELISLLKKDTKLLVVNFPHNPTGALPSENDWQTIVGLCRSRGIFLFSDEMYRLTNNDGSAPLESACKLYDKAITLFGMSKTFALPGLRVGWLCTQHEEVLRLMQMFKDYTTICGPAPCEILAIIALKNRSGILARTMGILNSNLAILNEFFAEFPDLFEWHPPRACTTGLAKVKGWLLELGDGGASGFCDVLVRKAGVLLVPTSMYDFPDQFVRVSFARKDMPQSVEALRKFLKQNSPS